MKKSLLAILLMASTCGGFSISPPLTRFAAGEVSPLFWNRYDLTQYDAGVKTLENFLVLEPGVVTRRPGTKYAATTHNNQPARLAPFVYSQDDAYILEFTDQYLRFYRSDALILDGASPYGIATVYEANELAEVQYYQSADVMYLSQGGHPPQRLVRSGHASWAIGDVNITDGPFLDENLTATTIEPNATTGTVTLIATADLFEDGHIGSLWRLRHLVPIETVSGTFAGTGDSNSLTCPKDVEFEWSLSGSWAGTAEVQISHDAGVSWSTFASFTATLGLINTPQGPFSNDTEQDALLRVSCTDYTSGTVRYQLWTHAHYANGVVRITDVNDANEVTATVLTTLGATDPTTRWSEGAWSDVRGWPACVSFNAERIMYASTAYQPLTVWASASGDYETFEPGTTDSDSFSHTISRGQQDPIQWVLGDHSHYWLVGTLGAVMELRPLDGTGGFTASNFPKLASAVSLKTNRIQPVLADDVAIFLSRTGKKVHEVMYDYQTEGLVAPDLTMWAPHITGEGVVQIAYQHEPAQILWAAREDGTLLGLTYHRPYNILAWHRHVTAGDVTSVAAIPVAGRDELWLCVEREVAGASAYFVEYLTALDIDAEIQDAYHLDAGESWDGGAAATILNITRANPGVVALATWPGLANGDNVRLWNLGGMTELEEQVYTVANANSTIKTLTLLDETGATAINTSTYTVYTSGGFLEKVENTFTGLSQWANETVQLYADGVPLGDVAVSAAGGFTLDGYYNTVHAGLAFASTFESLPIEIMVVGGLTAGRTKNIDGAVVSFYNSCGGKYGVSTASLRDIPWYRTPGQAGPAPVLKTESVNLPKTGGYTNKDLTFLIQQDLPWPTTIRGIVPLVSVQ